MKYVFLSIVVLIALLGLVACNGAMVLNTLTPSASFDRERDIAYGEHPSQRLDIYRAVEARADAPVLVFVHGGSWKDGSKDLYKFVGESFAREGYDVVIPSYRLHPESVYPDMVEDTALAASWAVERFGRSVVLMGHSAGGYNVLQTVFAPEISAKSGLDVCTQVAGAVALAPPTGAYELKEEPFVTIFPERFLGDDAPLNRAEAGQTEVPPVLFVHGTEDTTVGPKNSTELGAKLQERAQVLLVEGRGHIDVVRLLAKLFEDDSLIKPAVVEWLAARDSGGDHCAG